MEIMSRDLLAQLILLASVTTIAIAKTDPPCHISQTVDITNGIRTTKDTIVKDGIAYTSEDYYAVNGSVRGCICNYMVCVRKCCPADSYIYNRTCTRTTDPTKLLQMNAVDVYNNSRPLDNQKKNKFHVIYGRACPPNTYAFRENSSIYLQANGQLFWDDETDTYLNSLEYCYELFDDLDSSAAILCFTPGESEDPPQPFNSIGMLISMPFLVVTFLVYLFVPELQNLHGKSLMCYVATLFLAYLFLVVIQLNPNHLPDGMCHFLGFACYLGFMASFFWMNVMCIDIWWAFSGLRGFSGSKEAEKKRFLLYNAYAWGIPILLVIIISAIRFNPNTPNDAWYNPGLGVDKCWLSDNVPTLIYFYGPIAIMICTNITLFILTALKIRSVKQDTKVLKKNESQRHSNENEQRYNLYVKLLLAMGLNWSMEIISWAVQWGFNDIPTAVWYLTDFCNALYGVFIFFIFVFKIKVWKLLKKRYNTLRGRPMLGHVTYSGSQTRSTGFSRSFSHAGPERKDSKNILTNEVA